MVSSEGVSVVQRLENLVSVREYQGSSYGHVRFSGGDPEGHYRTVDFSAGVFSADNNRFNAYLRAQFAQDMLALYGGQEVVPSADGHADDRAGYSETKRQFVDEKIVEISYWSNSNRGACLPNNRMYALTVRMEAMPEEVAGLQKRVGTYFLQLQQTFGLASTNNVNRQREAA